MATVGQFLDEARSWLGTAEQPDGSNHVPGITDQGGFWDDAWCAMYGSVVCRNVGIPLWTVAVAEIMRKAQAGEDGWQWLDHPELGAMPCYDWGNGGARTDHVGGGGVEAIRDDGLMVVIEGNTGNDVVERVVRHQSNYVLGFALPPFTDPAPPKPQRKENDMFLVWMLDEGLHLFAAGIVSRYGMAPITCESLAAAGVPIINHFGDDGEDVVKQFRRRGDDRVDLLTDEPEEEPSWLPYDPDTLEVLKALSA